MTCISSEPLLLRDSRAFCFEGVGAMLMGLARNGKRTPAGVSAPTEALTTINYLGVDHG